MELMEAAANGFEGLDIEALRSYCQRMGVEFLPSHNAVTLRKKLKAALGEYTEVFDDSGEGEEEPSQFADQLTALGLTQLNLRSQGQWGGKRRVIQLHRSMDHVSSFPQFFAWGRLHCYVPFGQIAVIPYPIYNILLNTSGQRLVRRRATDEDGRIYFKESWVPAQRFMYTDMGDDPDTAHLPASINEMIVRLHGLTNGFKGFSERQYRELCSRLMIDIRPTWVVEDMRDAVITRCGLRPTRVDISRADNDVFAEVATG